MKIPTAYLSVLCAGLLAVGAAQAQTAPSAGNSDGPPKAGEASNQTQGVPNAKTTNSPFTDRPALLTTGPKSREQVVGELLARRGVYHAALQSRNLSMFQ